MPEIFISEKENHRISVFSLEGRLLRRFGEMGSKPGQFNHPYGIDSYKSRIYVCDTNNNRVQVFDSKGTCLEILGRKGSKEGEFNLPMGITIDSLNEEVYIVDGDNHRVQVFNLQGRFIQQFGNKIDEKNNEIGCLLRYPTNLAMFESEIYVTDSHHRVVRYNRFGEFLSSYGIDERIERNKIGISTNDGDGMKDMIEDIITFNSPKGLVFFNNKLLVVQMGTSVVHVIE